MSLDLIVQFAALAVVAGIGVCLVYVIFEMRSEYGDHQDQFLRTVSAVEEFQRLQPEFLSVMQRIEFDGKGLQSVALQIEAAVAELKGTIASSVITAAEKQSSTIADLRDHLDRQETKLAEMLEDLSESLRALPSVSTAAPPQPQASAPLPPAPNTDMGEYVRLRKDIIGNDSQLRFSLLKDWVSINILAILRRASLSWSAPNDLITSVPAYLEPDAEILNDRVLLVGTRGHARKLAIPIGDLDPKSMAGDWFDFKFEGHGCLTSPALLVRSNGHFDVIAKGTAARGLQPTVARESEVSSS